MRRNMPCAVHARKSVAGARISVEKWWGRRLTRHDLHESWRIGALSYGETRGKLLRDGDVASYLLHRAHGRGSRRSLA